MLTWPLVFCVVVGVALAWWSGLCVAQRRLPLAFVLSWLSLCFLISFVRFPLA